MPFLATKGGFTSDPVRLRLNLPGSPANPSVLDFYDVNGDKLADAVLVFPAYIDPSGGAGNSGVFAVALGDGKGNFTNTTELFTVPTAAGSVLSLAISTEMGGWTSPS